MKTPKTKHVYCIMVRFIEKIEYQLFYEMNNQLKDKMQIDKHMSTLTRQIYTQMGIYMVTEEYTKDYINENH